MDHVRLGDRFQISLYFSEFPILKKHFFVDMLVILKGQC